MKLKLTTHQIKALSLTGFMLFRAGPALAGKITIDIPGNSCAYTTYTNSNGDLTVTCASHASTPTQVVPVCTLTTSPAVVSLGGSSTLTANCTPAATSYVWTGPGMSGFSTTTPTGIVSPSSTTSYSVTGINSVGTGNTATTILSVSTSISSTLPPRTLREWVDAFQRLNNIPANRSTLEPLYEYYKLLHSRNPTGYVLPPGGLFRY